MSKEAENLERSVRTITEQEIHNIIAIMGRAEIKGSEAPIFMESVHFLQSLIGKEIDA